MGRSMQEDAARHRFAHHGEIDKLLGIDPDGRADIEHDALSLEGRPDRRDCRPLDARHGAQDDGGHRHQGAGIAGGERDLRIARPHCIDCLPHAALAPAPA